MNGGVPSTRELLRELRSQGWNHEMTKQGHYKCLAPDGKGVVMFADTTEPRGMKNNLSDLRRHGFVWPPPEREKSSPREDESWIDAPIASSPKPEPKKLDLDALFKNLKEAKAMLTVYEDRQAEAELAVRKVEASLTEAKTKAQAAKEEADTARRMVMEAKVEFDRAFEEEP